MKVQGQFRSTYLTARLPHPLYPPPPAVTTNKPEHEQLPPPILWLVPRIEIPIAPNVLETPLSVNFLGDRVAEPRRSGGEQQSPYIALLA